jgi:hypothetical protein
MSQNILIHIIYNPTRLFRVDFRSYSIHNHSMLPSIKVTVPKLLSVSTISKSRGKSHVLCSLGGK